MCMEFKRVRFRPPVSPKETPPAKGSQCVSSSRTWLRNMAPTRVPPRPAYSIQGMSMDRAALQAAFDYVDAHADAFVERLQQLCRQPSVSAQNLGLEETFGQVEQMARAVGAETQRIDLEGGPPILHARIQGNGPRTLQLYDHY